MANKKSVVILVHGIRDHALWQQEIRDVLDTTGKFKVASTNYGRFDLLRFLLPIGYFRRKAIAEVLEQIKIVFHLNPGADVSIIAHSFGTYIVGHILKDNFDLKFHRIILCGSILPYNFGFQHVIQRFTPDILNEVGTRDIWPAMAESVTWGYGSAGTFGFKRPLVYDRWHNGAQHGYFLNSEFTSTFWLPFLLDGTIAPDSAKPERPRWYVRLINVFKLKYVVPAAAAALFFGSTYVPPIPDWCPGLPGETAWVDAGAYNRDIGKFATQAVFKIDGRSDPPEAVRRGDWIELTQDRKTMILDYDKTGTERAMDSPFTSNGQMNHTCKSLAVGARLYVAFVDVNGPSDAESHMWLRVTETPPGS